MVRCPQPASQPQTRNVKGCKLWRMNAPEGRRKATAAAGPALVYKGKRLCGGDNSPPFVRNRQRQESSSPLFTTTAGESRKPNGPDQNLRFSRLDGRWDTGGAHTKFLEVGRISVLSFFLSAINLLSCCETTTAVQKYAAAVSITRAMRKHTTKPRMIPGGRLGQAGVEGGRAALAGQFLDHCTDDTRPRMLFGLFFWRAAGHTTTEQYNNYPANERDTNCYKKHSSDEERETLQGRAIRLRRGCAKSRVASSLLTGRP